MSAPQPRARPPRRRAGLAVQLGQTVFFLGVAALFFGLLVDDTGPTPLVGGALALIGAVLFVVGLRRRPRTPGD